MKQIKLSKNYEDSILLYKYQQTLTPFKKVMGKELNTSASFQYPRCNGLKVVNRLGEYEVISKRFYVAMANYCQDKYQLLVDNAYKKTLEQNKFGTAYKKI
jgi:hypothetical protein